MLDQMQLKCVSGIQIYSLIHQMALDTSHKYHEMLMQLVSFHSSVHNGRIPKLIQIQNPHMSNHLKHNFLLQPVSVPIPSCSSCCSSLPLWGTTYRPASPPSSSRTRPSPSSATPSCSISATFTLRMTPLTLKCR